MATLPVLQSTCDPRLDQIDSFSTQNFQFLANNTKDQEKKSSDFNFENPIETEDGSECAATDESDLEEIVYNSRNESMVKNVKPCLVEDENNSIFHYEEFMRESNFEQKTLCPCTE